MRNSGKPEKPAKVLREAKLKPKGEAKDGSHQTYVVSFEEDGVIKTGFYKKLDSEPAAEPNAKGNYPELLAKISVFFSVVKRLSQGPRGAEERLVFDDDDNIVGTLSIAIPGFKPFNFNYEPVPEDPKEREEVMPGLESLLDWDIMLTLFLAFIFGNNDLHNHNMGKEGDFDFDMVIYWFGIWMKGERVGILVPDLRHFFTQKDWQTFPRLNVGGEPNGNYPYHWPAFKHPGQESIVPVPGARAIQKTVFAKILPSALPKVAADPKPFMAMAGSPRAQEQKLAAALKFILTFDPAMLKSRLDEYFGDLPFNYTSLRSEIAKQYEQNFPDICNSETDKMPFSKVMTELILQPLFDNVYRKVVFYGGCDNNGFGVKLPPMHEALLKRPSLYTQILSWAEKENETTCADESSGFKYNLSEIERRYNQVWSHSYAPPLKTLLLDSHSLASDLLEKTTNHTKLPPLVSKEATDPDLTNAAQFLGTMGDFSIDPNSILVEKASDLERATDLMVEFTQKLYKILSAYYKKERTHLSREDNKTFSLALKALHEKYNEELRICLKHTGSDAEKFNRIASKLEKLAGEVNFTLHLVSTDQQMKDVFSLAEAVLPHTDPTVIRQFNERLFSWAKGLETAAFNKHVEKIIKEQYSKETVWAARSDAVKRYLAVSTETNDQKLAHIFASAPNEEGGKLNRLLVHEFAKLVKKDTPSISHALDNNIFDKALYCSESTKFAKTDPRFNHVYTTKGLAELYTVIYLWAECMPEQLELLKGSAMTLYKKGKWSWINREDAVNECFRESSAGKALALVFAQGEDKSSFSKIFFSKIIAEIKREVTAGKAPDLREKIANLNELFPNLNPAHGYQLINQLSLDDNDEVYSSCFSKIKTHPVTQGMIKTYDITLKKNALGYA